MALDTGTFLLFAAGVLTGLGLHFTVQALHEHVEIARYLRRRRAFDKNTLRGVGESTPVVVVWSSCQTVEGASDAGPLDGHAAVFTPRLARTPSGVSAEPSSRTANRLTTVCSPNGRGTPDFAAACLGSVAGLHASAPPCPLRTSLQPPNRRSPLGAPARPLAGSGRRL